MQGDAGKNGKNPERTEKDIWHRKKGSYEKMRQRKLKGLEEKLRVYAADNSVYAERMRGRWNELFDCSRPLFAELGCGKGQFILSRAEARPDRNFIAVEGNDSVMLRALQKAARRLLPLSAEVSVSSDGNELPFEELVPAGAFQAENIPEGAVCGGTHAEEKSGAAGAARRRGSGTGRIFHAAPNLIFVNMYIRDITECFAEDELSGIYLNFSDPWPKDRHAKRRLTHAGYLEGYRRVLRPESPLEFKTDNKDLFLFSAEELQQNGWQIEEYSEDLHASDFESKYFQTEYEEKFSSLGKPIYYCRAR